MNMMPQPGMLGAPQPPMPQITDEMIEEAKLVADACTWEEISGILRSDDRRNYSIDIQTDATAFEDEETEKAQRIELAKAMTEFFAFWGPAIQQNPSIKPFVRELALFTFGAFRAGRSLEETLGDAFDQIEQAPPPPDPEADKVKADMAMAAKQFEMDMQLKQVDLQGKQAATQANVQGKQADLAIKQQTAQIDMASQQQQLQADQQKAQLEMQIELAKLQLERERMQMEREKMGLEIQAANQKAQIDQQSMALDHQMHAEKSQLDLQTHREASDLKRDDMKFQSEFKRKEAARAASNA